MPPKGVRVSLIREEIRCELDEAVEKLSWARHEYDRLDLEYEVARRYERQTFEAYERRSSAKSRQSWEEASTQLVTITRRLWNVADGFRALEKKIATLRSPDEFDRRVEQARREAEAKEARVAAQAERQAKREAELADEMTMLLEAKHVDQCPLHPSYTGKRVERKGCEVCAKVYQTVQASKPKKRKRKKSSRKPQERR